MIRDLRAITIRPPWSEAVADGHKPIENRSKGFPKTHRGLTLIHASQKLSVRGWNDDRIRPLYPDVYTGDATWSAGKVIAAANLVDVHPAAGCCEPWGEQAYRDANDHVTTDIVHLVFEDAVRLRPIPTRGALGLWRPDPDLQLEVAHAMAELITWDLDAARRLADTGDAHQLWFALQPEAA